MSGFTDEGLARLKQDLRTYADSSYLFSGHDAEEMKALLARLECAEAIAETAVTGDRYKYSFPELIKDWQASKGEGK